MGLFDTGRNDKDQNMAPHYPTMNAPEFDPDAKLITPKRRTTESTQSTPVSNKNDQIFEMKQVQDDEKDKKIQNLEGQLK